MKKRKELLLEQILLMAYDMLVAGAEVGKTEKTIKRICVSYGMEEVEVFIITSFIIFSVKVEGRNLTLTKRITQYSTDFWKLRETMMLVDRICKVHPEYEEIQRLRQQIEEKIDGGRGKYEEIFRDIVFCLTCMNFTFFFGGSIQESILSFFSGLLLRISMKGMSSILQNQFVVNCLSAGVMTGFIWMLDSAGFCPDSDKVMMGNIMLLIPGLMMVNAVKDIISGEMITGLLRLTESLVQAGAIAIGITLTLRIL